MLGARRGEAADQLRRVAQRVVGPARIDAFRRKGDVEVKARAEPRLLEQRHDPLTCRAGVARRLDHDELAGAQDGADAADAVQQGLEIGLAVWTQRRRGADQYRIDIRQGRVLIGGGDPSARGGQRGIVEVLDVGLPGDDRRDPLLIALDTNDVDLRLSERDRQRQTDIAKTNHADAHQSSAV